MRFISDGARDGEVAPISGSVPHSITYDEVSHKPPGLADRTIAAVRAKFQEWDHHPSPRHWEGLRAIADNLEAQAEGRAAKVYAYSTLPVGIGKSTIIIEFIRQLVSDPAYADVGVAVFVSRLDQIKRMVIELEDVLAGDSPANHKFAVEAGKSRANDRLNRSGRGRPTGSNKWVSHHVGAQVLFSTQAKLLSISAGEYHHDYETFWKFNNTSRGEHETIRDYESRLGLGAKPRLVRIWDEAIMPAHPLVITPSEIGEYGDKLDAAGKRSLAQRVWEIVDSIRQEAARDATTFSFPHLLDYSLNELSNFEQGDIDSISDILWRMQGQKVTLRRNTNGTILTYRELLPKNLAPMVILDASGDLRDTYRIWAKGRHDLVRLPSEPKTYRNLTIHHFDHGAGQNVYDTRGGRESLARAAANAFFSVPDGEDVLVIIRKPDKDQRSIIGEIMNLVRAEGGDPERIKHITWGFHTATNEFAKTKHVIMLGMLQYSDDTNEATWRAAFGAMADAEAPWQDVERVREGEIAQHVFQAVGRGAIRRSVGGDVPEGCTLWAVFSTKAATMAIQAGILTRCFPGAAVREWWPFKAPMKESRERFVAALLRRLGDQSEVAIILPELYDSFSRRMCQRYIKDPDILNQLRDSGVVVEVEPGRGQTPSRYTLRRTP